MFNFLLQILDDGRLTDGKGRVVDFKNAVIIMTSNVGSETIAKQPLGFTAQAASAEGADLEQRLLEELRKAFRPEFLNRVDEIIVFKQLTEEQLEQIVDLLLGTPARNAMGQGMALQVTEEAKRFLVERGTDVEYGARPLKRAIQRLVENPLSSELLRHVRPGRHHRGRGRRGPATVQQGAAGRDGRRGRGRGKGRQGVTRPRGRAFFGGLLGGLAGALLAPRLRGPGRGVLPGQYIRNTLGLRGASPQDSPVRRARRSWPSRRSGRRAAR